MKTFTGHWLLHHDFAKVMAERAINFDLEPSAYEAFIERRSSPREDGDLFIRADGVAHILIVGVLTAEPDFFFDLFGGGSAVYGDIVAAIAAAEDDDDVKRIVLEIDSPGGETSGFFRTAQAIAATVKPIEAQVTNMAASSAFGLASQTDKIVAENPMVMLGSIGVVQSFFVSENRIQIASTEAPNKRPDVTTDEGVAAVRLELDALHAEFVEVIASGRKISVAEVNADFGRGGLVIAGAALQAGMIDGIDPGSARGVDDGPSSNTTASTERGAMNLQDLQSEHPALCVEIRGLGFTAGVTQERDRVTAHVEASKAAGKPELAFEFIASGADFTSQVVQAKYFSAGVNRADATARADDDAAANGLKNEGGKKGGGDGDPDPTATTNAVFDQLETDMGLGGSAEV